MCDEGALIGSSDETYRPTMGPDAEARIRRWHERAYASLASRDEVSEVDCAGRTFTVHPWVFPPVGELMGQVVLDEVQEDDRVLDVGTGSGVNAILAASRSHDVVAVDINREAVACARHNVAVHGVSAVVDVIESDLFQRVEGTFDLMVFDPPFRWLPPRNDLETAITDQDYGTLRRFLRDAPSRLRPDGRILLHFGTSADLGYLDQLLGRLGYAVTVMAEEQAKNEGWTVEYFVFRLQPVHQRGSRRRRLRV